MAGRHLLAVIEKHTRVVLVHLDVDGKTDQITAFAPAAGQPTGIDLTAVLFTTDALHTQREPTSHLAYGFWASSNVELMTKTLR